MSTIAQNLAALQQAKEDIAEAISDMGGTVQEGDGFSSFAADIMTIPAGGGGNLETKTVALDMSSGDQEITPSSGYDGLEKATVTRPTTLIPENIKDGVSIGGITGNFVGSAIPNELDDLVDGTITSFTMPQGKTKVRSYLFEADTFLTSANLQGAIEVGNYAFSGCSNAEIILPSTLTSISNYAFFNSGKSSSPMILNCPNSVCHVGNYAFQSAKISKISGKFSALGISAFQSCTTLTEIDINECSSIGQNSFVSCNQVTKLHLNINGTIASNGLNGMIKVNDLNITGIISGTIGQYAFTALGRDRQNASQNVLLLDLKNSTFTAIEQYAFGSSQSSTGGLSYFRIIIPATCASIGAYGFGAIGNSDIYFIRETPATIQSNTFQNMSNTNLWIPYNSVNAYRTAPNWNASTVVSSIKGYAKENTFTIGQTLPTINEEGYGLTWYSDKACTVQVTTVSDPTQELYCIVGTTVLAYRIQSVNTVDCTVTFSDGTNTYMQGDQVPVGTSLTIASVATDPTKTQVYMFDINGTDYKPATSETITVASDITVICLYYDGVNIPVNPTFADNSWDMIKFACESGIIPSEWNLGDTKTDGNGNAWMLVDKKANRYEKVNGGYTNAVFMKVPLYASSVQWASSGGSSHPTYASSTVHNRLQSGGSYYALEDQTLMALIDSAKIIVKSSQYNTSSTSDTTVGMFAPCYTEMGHTGSYQYATSAETLCNGVTMGSFEYFQDDVNSKRIKRTPSNQVQAWWLRSRHNSNNAVFVTTGGAFSYGVVAGTWCVAPCFAW